MLILININPLFGGRLFAVSYITIRKLNPFLSLLVIMISDIIICVLVFYFAQTLRKINFFERRLRKINDKWIKSGTYIGFFVGQLFIGTLFVSLIVGLIKHKENDILFFYVPLISSVVFYTLIYYYLSFYGINFTENLLHELKFA
ncbi:MAG: hypothetical protein ACYCTD_00505 [bacterium]